MTRDEFTARVVELINDAPEWLEKECLRLFDSGAIDTERYECNYRLPKNIFVVALENLSNQYTPPGYRFERKNTPDMKAIKNLRKF